MELVKEVQLLAIKEGRYTVYVFKTTDTHEYIMCTKLPNWQTSEISIGDIGYLKYIKVRAGEEYTTPEGVKINYKYSNVYFENFINKNQINNNCEIIL